MPPLSHPLRFLVVAPAGWINQQQREVIDYLLAENRVAREQLGARRLRFTGGIASEPDSAWVVQCGRQLTDAVDGILVGNRAIRMDILDFRARVLVIQEARGEPDRRL